MVARYMEDGRGREGKNGNLMMVSRITCSRPFAGTKSCSGMLGEATANMMDLQKMNTMGFNRSAILASLI